MERSENVQTVDLSVDLRPACVCRQFVVPHTHYYVILFGASYSLTFESCLGGDTLAEAYEQVSGLVL